MSLYVPIVVLHVASATLWFAGALLPSRMLREGAAAGPDSFRLMAALAARSVRYAAVGSVLTLLSGVAMIFVRFGGMGGAPPTIHTALTLVLVAVLAIAGGLLPAMSKIVAAAEAGQVQEAMALKGRVGAISGISHLAWLVSLVLMFWGK